jgi:urease accessory protein
MTDMTVLTQASVWQGEMALTFTCQETRTQLSQVKTIAPYRVQRSFQNPDGSCQVIMLHTAGGMVSGDRLTAQIHLGDRAQALLTTAAAGKIYRSTGSQTRQQAHITVGSHARLEWLPQETIIFDGAWFQQSLRIDLNPGATALVWDVTRLGRTAHGERFTSGEWRSHSEVFRQGVPLWIDRQWLPASETLWQSPHGLSGDCIVGTLAWIGQAVSLETIQELRDLWQGSEDLGTIGVTRLTEGLVCRYRGKSSHAVRQWFLAIWQTLRSISSAASVGTSGDRQSWEIPRVWMI